jgi:hypothetical protein
VSNTDSLFLSRSIVYHRHECFKACPKAIPLRMQAHMCAAMLNWALRGIRRETNSNRSWLVGTLPNQGAIPPCRTARKGSARRRTPDCQRASHLCVREVCSSSATVTDAGQSIVNATEHKRDCQTKQSGILLLAHHVYLRRRNSLLECSVVNAVMQLDTPRNIWWRVESKVVGLRASANEHRDRSATGIR